MGYMSVKDENFPRAQGVLRGKTPFFGGRAPEFMNLEDFLGSDHFSGMHKVWILFLGHALSK